MKRPIITLIFLVIAFFIVVSIKNFIKRNAPIDNGGVVACPMDAMMCPNGKYVGRTGSMCEFKCPQVQATSTASVSATLGLNETFVINGVTIKPWAVTQDSRCPSDVVCIQAGKVIVALNVASSTMEIEPGQTKMIDTLSVTLNDVTPYPISTHKTTDQEYKFSFTFKSN